ncbi:Aste57867_3544 [Aphanomyces stellatus]|uniref:Aste57867_3544 protein n=1 Tax=Aphanomyces stellatus TaxID=120398 RepID=A0A485KBM2_9STRA|nr:hypothetical protein As57867_003533 [Aphanomyces stellatus]VFT80707.1 Aste57867_3544 [Aphanomyces stellatus]
MAFVLVAASPAQQLEADKYTYSSWGAPKLTMEQYLAREHALCATEFAKETLTGYVLVPEANPETLDILAYVELFKRPCLYGAARIHGYSVGSVYTPAQHRKKGYASIMLQQLVDLMRADNGGIVVSNLYSDIGPTFYANKGWAVHSSDQLIFPTSFPSAAAAEVSLSAIDSAAALAQVCQQDVASMAAQMSPSDVYFELTPSVVTWFQTRSHFYATTTEGLASGPTVVGVFQKPHHLLWTHDFKHGQLVILRCHVDQANFPAFLHAALHEAKAWNLQGGVTLWNPAPWMAAAFAPFLETRDESLPSLMVSSDHGSLNDIRWLGNEKYVWV